MKSLPRGLQVEEYVEVREVVAEGTVAAGLSDIVWVEPGAVVRSGEHEVAVVVGRHAEGGVDLMINDK